jgi:glycosyltransferase involved in cell wall biosynthesis
MKLNWFSPLPPAATDIAHYTSRVLPALSAVSDVTLWTTKRQWPKSLESFAEIRRYGLDRPPWTELNRADMTFYHIGNNPKFHWPIWHVSRIHPGVVVLHDFRLHHFFDWIYRCHYQDRNLYLETIETYYGANARSDAKECFNTSARNIDYMAEQYPLTELALENVLGVMVHTPDAFKALEPKAEWPLAYAPLPFPSGGHLDSRPPGPPYRLIIFGYLGRNRRIESVLKALAELPEKDQFRLDIFGSILDGPEGLQSQIRALKLSSLVKLHGFVAEERLRAALAAAHLAINLRFPTVGEASGTQLRIWSHALPSLVTPEGWYASLPPDAVAFVPPGIDEAASIQQHLRRLLQAPEEFAEMGLRGYEKLKVDHAPQAYATKVIELAERAKQYRLQRAAELLAKRAGAPLFEWLGPEHLDERLRHVVGEALSLVKG